MEVILETWGRVVKDNIFFIMSKESDNTSYIDWEANEIHVAYRNFTNSRGEFVADYEPENLSGWQAPLVAKIMKFWEYMAMVYEQEWAHRCAWFVKTDDDTWLNAKLVQQRLECLDPDIELNFGYSCGFGVGVYTGYSRAVVRNMAYYINTLKPEVTSDWFIGDIEDRRVGQLLMRFGVFIEKAVRRNGTKRPDYMLWDKTYTKEQRAEWGRQLTKKQIGCLTFAHHSRPLVMKALTENLDSALKDTDGVACPSSWRKKGMTKKLIEGIAKNCPV